MTLTRSSNIGDLCSKWWRSEVKPHTESGSGAARAARAQLRRADTPLAALSVSATHKLHSASVAAYPQVVQRPDWPDRLALIAVGLGSRILASQCHSKGEQP